MSAVRALWALSGLYLRGNIHDGAFLPLSDHLTGHDLADVDDLLHIGIEHPAQTRGSHQTKLEPGTNLQIKVLRDN